MPPFDWRKTLPQHAALPYRYENWLSRYLPMTEIASINSTTANSYVDMRLDLRSRGLPIPQNDVWIAALARQHDLSILSNDNHFDLVERVVRIPF